MLNQTILNYKLTRLIGEGGMATVYLAEDKKFLTNVAVKVLAKEFAHNENIRKRFLAEARNMFKMSHPNIIKVTDLIDDGDTVAFVMEHIEGETLKEYLERKGKLSDDEIKNLFSHMLEAVGYVHKQNLIHRDIKPSNFMINSEGQIKLLDFGIAKNTDNQSSDYTQTGTSQNMGTPMYMSPEQIKSTKDVTLQSDIYSLGVVLWQMVMGKKPYNINTISTFELQTKIVTEPLSKTNTNWDKFILRATAKDINDRYTDCENWLIDIKGFDTTLNSDDRTILNHSNSNEYTIIEQKPKIEINIHECPRCLGKGHVDKKDIKRLKRELDWMPGPCAYCDGTGKVDDEMLQSTNADDANLTYESDDLEDALIDLLTGSKAFYGGHIDDLDEFLRVIVSSFNGNYYNVWFNDKFKFFKNKSNYNLFNEDNTYDLKCLLFPEELIDNFTFLALYKSTRGLLFSKKELSINFAAFITDEQVEANLVSINDGLNVYRYSLSCWIDSWKELPCVSSLEVQDDVLKISSYCVPEDESEENEEFYDEIKLTREMCQVINRIWSEIDSRGLL
jgi:serine/threonine protein kinase